MIEVIIDKKIGQKIIINHHKILHSIVTGTISPYQTVAIVTNAHHIASGIESNIGLCHHSTQYTVNDHINHTIKNSVKAIWYLYRFDWTACQRFLRNSIYFHTLNNLKTLHSLNIFKLSTFRQNPVDTPIRSGRNDKRSAIEKGFIKNFRDHLEYIKRIQ